MRLPSLSGLKAFEAVARHLSMKLAATELCVTASAVSQLVRALEQELGVPLLVRGHRSLTLSREGQALLPAVRNAFRLVADASDRIRRPLGSGSLTVSTTTFFADTWIVPHLHDFTEQHPEIELRITTNTALANLGAGEADVAVRHGLGDYSGMTSDLLVAPPVMPVASPKLIKRLGKPAEADDLLRWPLLHDADRGGWALWFAEYHAGAPAPLRGVSFDDPALLRSAVLNGLGAALLPQPSVSPQLDEGTLVALGPAARISSLAYYLVVPRIVRDPVAVSAFRSWLRGLFETSDAKKASARKRPTRSTATLRKRRR